MLLMPGVRPGGVFASMLYCCIFRWFISWTKQH